MSSDLYAFDGSSSASFCFNHPSPEILSSSFDPFSLFFDTNADFLQEITETQTQKNSEMNSNSFEHFATTPSIFSSSSPPSRQLENLNLEKNQTNGSNTANGYQNLSVFNGSEVKSEMIFDSGYNNINSFMPHSYSGVENVSKYMQRSFSGDFIEGKPEIMFNTQFDSTNFGNPIFRSPENSFFAGQMRRVCSTGDLLNRRKKHVSEERSYSSPVGTEGSYVEETNSKVGRYSVQERKERISRYRAKRTQRNFNKTIKYACRKTLADNRPRIRGRFARNDEISDIPKVSTAREEDEDDLWLVDEVNEEEERGSFINGYGETQFQYYGCF